MPGITTYNAVKDSAEEIKDELLNFMVYDQGVSEPKVWSPDIWADFATKARGFQTLVKDFNTRKRMHKVNRTLTQDLLPMAQALADTMDIYENISKAIDAMEDLPGLPQTTTFSDSALEGVKFKLLQDPATLPAGTQQKLTDAGIPVDANAEYLLRDLRDLGILQELVDNGYAPKGALKDEQIKALLKSRKPLPDPLMVLRGVFQVLRKFNIAALESRIVWE